MKISMVSFTAKGQELSKTIQSCLSAYEVQLFTKCSAASTVDSNITFIETSIGQWTKEMMEQKNALVFIGACGIAVRAIAPHVVNKLEDSPVLVLDEKGDFVIPILSGHVGGANALAVFIGQAIGAQPVITTATDVQKKFAVDLFAKSNDLCIENKDGIAKVSSKVLNGEVITMAIEDGHLASLKSIPNEILLVPYPPMQKVDVVITSEDKAFDAVLTLKPKTFVVGMGCRKGKNYEAVENFVANTLEQASVPIAQVSALASIDVKADEPALKQWCQVHHVPFLTYGKDVLEQLEGDFEESPFVKQTVGVGNVCERAALTAAGDGGQLILGKCAWDGMTLAIGKKRWSVTFDE